LKRDLLLFFRLVNWRNISAITAYRTTGFFAKQGWNAQYLNGKFFANLFD